MSLKHRHTVPGGIADIRFSDYVRDVFSEFIPSRKGIKKAIKRGDFVIDGQVATTGLWIKEGQVIELTVPDSKPRKVFKLQMEIPFEDQWMAVVHKPAGFVVSGNKFMTIQNALLHNLSPSEEADALQLPRPCHRLDRSTSGVLLVAKTARAAMAIGQQLEQRQIHKRYRAIVVGKIAEHGTVTTAIEERDAVSDYHKINSVQGAKYDWLSRVDLFPHTGRTHQLRIHMAGLGHEIVGDKLYGGKEGQVMNRAGLFLCAVEVKFRHPITDEPVTVTIDEPPKFEKYMDREHSRWRGKS